MGPWIRRDSMAYSEQVGKYLQDFGSQGEINHWYNFTGTIRINTNKVLIPLIKK